MRSGVRIGIDVGKARIGIARSDLHGMLATPVETVARSAAPESTDTDRIVALIREFEAFEVIVGLPLNLQGQRTPSTDDAETFAVRLATALQQNANADTSAAAPAVRLVDERLSTVSAHSQLRAAGKKSKQTRHVIDQAAAVVILQHALESERAQHTPPGTPVHPSHPSE